MTTLDSYITLGRSGLRVSPYCLGTMTFGEENGWGASVAESEAMLDGYLDRGGNFVDTANVYTGGHSEQILGDALAARPGTRDRIVLASKFFANLEPGNPNGGGTGRKALLGALHNSLRRLRTDYLDIYWIHNWDARTPINETLRTLDDLVTAGLVKREQGRGTFVMRPKVAKQMAMTSFTDGMRERGLTPGSDVTGFRRLRATAVQARALRIPTGEAVFRFTRLRSADGEPVGLETTWVAAEHVPGLERADLRGSWYELLDERYDIQVLTGTSIVEIGYAAERDAQLLGCEVGAALLRIETTSYAANGRIVDFGIDLFRGDRYSLVTYRMPNLGFRGASDRQRVMSAAPTSA